MIPHSEDVLLEGFEVFRDPLVVSERADALTRLRIRAWNGGDDHVVQFDEPAYVTYLENNPEIETGVLRFGYESMTTPTSIYDYGMETRERTLLKRDEVLGGYDPSEYRTERVWAIAGDGTRVPISLVVRTDLRRSGPQPLLLYTYGSYGSSRDPNFYSFRLSLLDRGFVFAIAHVRGGSGDGPGMVRRGPAAEEDEYVYRLHRCGRAPGSRSLHRAGDAIRARRKRGRPAGGCGDQHATRFLPRSARLRAVRRRGHHHARYEHPADHLRVGRVGDPRRPEVYEYMLSYSPYDQVRVQPYPHMLVTTGLHDSQVQYWEPAKWVARLRAMDSGDHVLLPKTDMEAGSGGASGRYRRWREIAFDYAFVLDLAGLAEAGRASSACTEGGSTTSHRPSGSTDR
jgi:oligopeptidase B